MDKKEKLLSQINQEQISLKRNNYKDIIDEREHRINAFVEKLKTLDFDDRELDILLSQKELLKTLANQEPNWRIEIKGFLDDAECDIGYFLQEQARKERLLKKKSQEEM